MIWKQRWNSNYILRLASGCYLVLLTTCFSPPLASKQQQTRSSFRHFVSDTTNTVLQVSTTSSSTETIRMEESNDYNSQTQQQQLSYHQHRASRIASSFVSRDYNPHPWFRNRHIQTILGVFLRDECGYVTNLLETITAVVTKGLPRVVTDDNSESSSEFWDQRIRYETPDDDFFDVDYKYTSSTEKDPMVIIVHGLESNSNSSLSLHMARAYVDQGMNVACINFRGCSGEPNRTMKPYHAGFTEDLKHFLTILLEDENNKINNGLYLSGFSLGANVVMKTLGELSLAAVEKYNIQGAAVSGAPFSLHYHWRCLIDDDFNRNVYANTLLKSMKKVSCNLIEPKRMLLCYTRFIDAVIFSF